MCSSSVEKTILVRHDKSPLGDAQRRRGVEVVNFALNLLHPREHLSTRAKVVPVRDARVSSDLAPTVGDSLAILVPVPVRSGLDPALLTGSRCFNEGRLGLVHIHVAGDTVDPPLGAVLPDDVVTLVGTGAGVLGHPVLAVGGEGRGGDLVVVPIFGSVESGAVSSVVDGFAKFDDTVGTD